MKELGRSLGRTVGGSYSPGVDPGTGSLGDSPAVGHSVGGRPGEDIQGVRDQVS